MFYSKGYHKQSQYTNNRPGEKTCNGDDKSQHIGKKLLKTDKKSRANCKMDKEY